ncbi:MAG: class III lanthionine synthetase LanKC, partial [Nocardiopsaceae bacterium]|nr:class III lanthionine synthetase LanKC [Nocardiopsaceae bacterium]
VSACLDNAEKVLALVWEYCVNREISFKHLRAESSLLMRNAKYAPRGSSGKFVTIYPADDTECERILTDLDPLLTGQSGPYILSDLRIGDGPIYVRYGAFTERYVEDGDGELVPAIEDASGQLVPDRRAPVFGVPDWIELPGFLAPHLAASKAVTMTDLPYRVEQALHFSNGGGVYTGIDTRTEEKVVLKEARPFAGLAADGSDAVDRLRRERDILRQLDGISGVPGVRDYFECGGHHFLVQEFIEGRPLNTCYVERYPLLQPDPDPAALDSYTEWALRMSDAVADVVRQLHERGVVFNDLHMFNVMVRPDDSVALLDFEVAARVDEDRRRALGNPGFAAPRDRKGLDSDRYSLACLRLAMFLPLTMLFQLDRAKAAHFAEIIAENFPVPSGYLDAAVREITGEAAGPRDDQPQKAQKAAPGKTGTGKTGTEGRPRFEPDPAGLTAAEASLARAILASATPDRDDRLFPGDIRQFDGEALGLGHGAAGILYTLSRTTGERFPEFEDWLISRAQTPPRGTKLGLYDGLVGVACVLSHLGHPQEAVKVAELGTSERWERLGTGLYGGLAGLALGLLYLGDATGERALTDAGLRAAELTASRLEPAPAGASRAGLMHGASGPALLFVRMFERTGDTGYLDLAAVALGRDLDACVIDGKGALAVNEGWRTMPYLGDGSAGIGLVAQDYLGHADDERLAEAVPRIRQGARSVFYVQPGLLAGRAGMILSLSRDASPGQSPGSRSQPAGEAVADPDIASQIRRLEWHAVSYSGGTAFPGDNLLRLSMDLATGTAGVLLALHAVRHPDSRDLPFTGAL